MEFLVDENKRLRNVIREIAQDIHDAGGCDAGDDYSEGWDNAIAQSLSIIETKSGVTIDEILEHKCS